MATVIDSFVMTLGLDPTDFDKSQKKAAEGWLKTRDQAVKTGKEIESSSQKAADAISKVTREVLALFAVFVGARGLKEFVSNIVTADAALGRFSRNLGESPQTVSAWGAAAERMGGSAEATAGSFERIGKALYDLHRNGTMLPKEYSQLSALTGVKIDRDHGVDKFLRDTATALKAMNAIDPAQAHFLAQGMGIDDGTANVMIRYGSAIGTYIDQLKKLSPSNDAIKAAQQLQEKWVSLQQTAVSLANTLLERLGPQLEGLLTKMADWVTKNQDWIRSGIVKAVKDFAEYLKGIDWNAVGTGLSNFATGAKTVADSIGGITTATEILFGLWAGSKALGVIANMRGAMGAGSAGAGAAAGGSGILAALGYLGMAAGGAYSLVNPGDALNNAPRRGYGVDDLIRHLLGTDGSSASPSQGGSRVELPEIPYGSGARDPGAHADALANTVDGRPVSKANPLPVTVAQQPSSGGFWSSVGNAIGGLFGVGTANASAGSAAGAAAGSVPITNSGKTVARGSLANNQREAYAAAVKEGLSPTAAKALVANMSGEALHKPGDYHMDGTHMAQGIVQWDPARAAAIKAKFGSDPMHMSVADQTKAAVWEMKTNPRFAKTWAALNGSGTSAQMIDTLVRNYEVPANPNKAISQRIGYLNGLKVDGNAAGAARHRIRGAKDAASYHDTRNDNRSSSVSTSQTNVNGPITVHTAATDAHGVAGGLSQAIKQRTSTATTANYGPV